MNMSVYGMLLVSSLAIGSIYGLIALGYALIYKSSGLLSFTQGDILTLGAYLGLTFYSILGIPFAISLLLTMACAFVLGILLEKGVIRQLLNKNVGAIYVVLATIAISYIIQNGSQLAWGTIQLNFPSVFPVQNVFREDVVVNGDDRENILKNAPEQKDGSFVVPKTVD